MRPSSAEFDRCPHPESIVVSAERYWADLQAPFRPEAVQLPPPAGKFEHAMKCEPAGSGPAPFPRDRNDIPRQPAPRPVVLLPLPAPGQFPVERRFFAANAASTHRSKTRVHDARPALRLTRSRIIVGDADVDRRRWAGPRSTSRPPHTAQRSNEPAGPPCFAASRVLLAPIDDPHRLCGHSAAATLDPAPKSRPSPTPVRVWSAKHVQISTARARNRSAAILGCRPHRRGQLRRISPKVFIAGDSPESHVRPATQPRAMLFPSPTFAINGIGDI